MRVLVVLAALWAGALACAPAPGCTCSTGDLVTYSCGGIDLKTREDGYIEVECWGNQLNCSKLPHIKVGKKETLERVEISSCSLAPELPLTCVLQAVGASGASVLAVQRGASGLSERNVAGLDVEVLNMMYEEEYHPSSFPARAVGALGGLRRARLVYGDNVTLSANMFAAAPPLHYLEIGSSGVRDIPDDAFVGLAHLTELSLWGNEIEHVSQYGFRGLSSLEKLYLNRNPLRSLPRGCLALAPRLRILHLERTRLSEMQEGTLAGLNEMQEIRIISDVNLTLGAKALSNLPLLATLVISGSQVPGLPPDVLHNSTALVNLTLADNNLASLPDQVFRDLRKLEILDLRKNLIENVTQELFRNLVSLNTLYLDGNLIQTLPGLLFSGLTSLQTVQLSGNSIRYISLDAFTGLEYLERLDLSHNLLDWAPDDGRIDSSPMNGLKGLKELVVSHNSISRVPLDWRVVLPLHRLARLDLSHNAFTALSAADVNFLGKANGEVLDVDFRYNRIELVQPTPLHQWAPPLDNVRLRLDHNPFHCNCLLFDLLTVLQKESFKYQIAEAACQSPPSLQNMTLALVPLEDLTCSVELNSSDVCLYRRKYLRTECDLEKYVYNVTEIPDPNEIDGRNNMSLRLRTRPAEYRFPEFVRELILFNLSIREVPPVPTTVQVLNLTENKIGSVPDHLYRDGLTLFLEGNPIACECATSEAVAKMIRMRARIGDFERVTCESGFAVSAVDPPGLCYEQNAATLGFTIAVMVSFVTVAAAILYLYRVEIQVLLYSTRCCLFLLPKRKADYGKKYQVFLSLEPANWAYVAKEVLPHLRGYTVQVQERDWVIGEKILDLIHESIADSMMSLLVVTPEYLAGPACAEVLRTLHERALRDKRRRALLLLVGVRRSQLDKELRRLLALAYVVEEGERWCWQKIRYALPNEDLVEHGAGRANVLNNNIYDKMAATGLQVALNDRGQLINAAFVKDIV